MAPSATTSSPSPGLPPPSALNKLINSSTPSADHPTHLHHLALQIQHNLQHQHLWTSLRIHTHCPLPSAPQTPLSRPLISGLPPQRVYIHPDEQIELLQREHARKKSRRAAGKADGEDDEEKEELRPEREWVLPTHLREKWSLRKFGEVFDGIGTVPPEAADEADEDERGGGEEGLAEVNKWRTTKRVLLATLDDDSTVVYYIVHDGLVKPRQN
ncbi:hypothetical protein B0A49_10993 [Cryomyces minteri]|uniref:tRNA-splicing endonuclease subunit Sen15 domain-containing protein n=1 Tax=Cryomyces minteri TaxID=331657 RepID=A0A4U0WFR3_9PEZI|nr:hypothetical protein B0A49_10993 [Cryomyces minteri]